MLAQVCGYKVGELVHVIADAHIYDRHIPIIQELIKRPIYDAPEFYINPEIKDFYQFKVEDFELRNYKYGPKVEIPVAI